MKYKHNKSLTSNARVLRKNMTKEERHIWYDYLRTYPIRFLRQKAIGNFEGVCIYIDSIVKERLQSLHQNVLTHE